VGRANIEHRWASQRDVLWVPKEQSSLCPLPQAKLMY
jgi:hypothetical protein